jgi:uncharacterized metal-binding protein YceD (DUF177 family)
MITKDGTLAFKVLEKQDIEVDCDKQDRWIIRALEDAAPALELCDLTPEEWAAKSEIQVHIEGSRLVAQNEYQVKGSIKAMVPALCGRCGEALMSPRESEFTQYYQLVDEEKEVEDSGDADLILTTSADIDLRELISERLMLVEPMVEHHPEGACEAPALEATPVSGPGIDKAGKASPFARLKGLKFD